MTRCASVQERLAEEGLELVDRDAAVREHVADCPVCGPLRAALEQVDADLARLAPLSAPASLLAATARAVAHASHGEPPKPRPEAGAGRLATALAASVVLAAGFALVHSVQEELVWERGVAQAPGTRPPSGDLASEAREFYGLRAPPAAVEAPSAAKAQAPQSQASPRVFRGEVEPAAPEPSLAAPPRTAKERGPAMDSPARAHANRGLADYARPAEEQKKRDRQVLGGEGYGAGVPAASDVFEPAAPPSSLSGALGSEEVARRNSIIGEYDRSAAGDREDRKPEAESPTLLPTIAEMPALEPAPADERDDLAQRRQLSTPGKSGRLAAAKNKLEKSVRTVTASGSMSNAGPRDAARRFLAEHEQLTGLAFEPSSGYWANTYVPGDPAIRLLEARLQRWNRGVLAAGIGEPRLEAAARQNRQPFDVPQNAALATYLHADKRAVEGRSRLRVQVGLQASRKRSGLRPDMNVGVVLDARRPLDEATGARVRALMLALAKARQPGDRFSITVAGHPGGLLVAPAEFRHGPVQVAMQSLFADGDTRKPAMDLLAAMHTASQNVRAGDDASGPLGASLVLLVSTTPLAGQREALERMAHENAVAGVGLSVVAAGDTADLDAIDRLVLLGQGHRRVLTTAEGAAQLVDRELHASSRAVARAVRLRIRLAPGVELVEVLGSKNLSEDAAERVREAERSIDERLARNIGIRADRGEDEEGIQIVIPSFFAGDSHALLLDVVVPGAGPVADVSVRYKDLVYRRNGVARARLAIADGRPAPGPLERNVLKNHLAHELARSAAIAGRLLGAGDHQGAVEALEAVRDLLVGMQLQIPGWDSDDELGGDVALLDQYLRALGSGHAAADPHRRRLADSLRFTAHRRLIPPYK